MRHLLLDHHLAATDDVGIALHHAAHLAAGQVVDLASGGASHHLLDSRSLAQVEGLHATGNGQISVVSLHFRLSSAGVNVVERNLTLVVLEDVSAILSRSIGVHTRQQTFGVGGLQALSIACQRPKHLR